MVSDGLGADVGEIRRELTGAADEMRKAGSEVTGGIRSVRTDLRAATDVKKVFPTRAHRTRRPAATAAAGGTGAAAGIAAGASGAGTANAARREPSADPAAATEADPTTTVPVEPPAGPPSDPAAGDTEPAAGDA
jgi:hypothetical protein